MRTFEGAQVKILLECSKQQQVIDSTNAEATLMEAQIEASIAAEDYAQSGQIQKILEEKKKQAAQAALGIKQNKTRYGKGEEAKHKMINSEIELRQNMLGTLVAYRIEQEEKGLEFVTTNTDKLNKGALKTLSVPEGTVADIRVHTHIVAMRAKPTWAGPAWARADMMIPARGPQ